MIYESIIRDMAEGIMTIDLNGTIDSFNPAAEKILGRKRDEVVGNHFARLFIRDPENDTFTQTVLDAIYEPMERHEKVVPWHYGGQVKQLFLVSSFSRGVGTIFQGKQGLGTGCGENSPIFPMKSAHDSRKERVDVRGRAEQPAPKKCTAGQEREKAKDKR